MDLSKVSKRTSITDPYQLQPVCQINESFLYMGCAPGRKQPVSRTGRGKGWNRDLDIDLSIIKKATVKHLVCLIEFKEFKLVKIGNYFKKAEEYGLIVHHFPIQDMSVPNLYKLHRFLEKIHRILSQDGESVLVHCKGGIGRAGLVSGAYLCCQGLSFEESRQTIRWLNSRSLTYPPQRNFLKIFESMLIFE